MANALELRNADDPAAPGRPDDPLDSEELLELLGDEYARAVLRTIADEPKAGQEIAEETDASAPTVYRRLEELETAGLVEAEMVFDDRGHHYRQFRAVFESANLRFDGEGVSVSVRTGEGEGASRSAAALSADR